MHYRLSKSKLVKQCYSETVRENLERPEGRFERLTFKDRQRLRNIETNLGEEGSPEDLGFAREVVEYERLEILLAGAFGEMEEALYLSVCRIVHPGSPAPKPDIFVGKNLMAPEDSPLRKRIIGLLTRNSIASQPGTRRTLRLFQELERFLHIAAQKI